MVNKDFANCINMLCNSLCDVVHKSVEVCLQKLTVKKPRRNQRWWNVDCTNAKQRNKVFHTIWRECGKPSSGTVYENYKYAKKFYRIACRLAMNHHINIPVVNINKLFQANKSADMWRLIRKTKMKPSETKDCITMDNLREYFESKFLNSYIKHLHNFFFIIKSQLWTPVLGKVIDQLSCL